MVQTASGRKNIWIAASDGDIERVKYLIENQGLSPNAKDENEYTPMHAAASYHHLDLLEYLISVGGDINLRDDDGQTPLFTVESVEAARWLVEHGADPFARANPEDEDDDSEEGQLVADYHEDDHPEISAYLRSLQAGGSAGQPISTTTTRSATSTTSFQPSISSTMIQDIPISESNVDSFTSQQTDGLLAETQRIMREAERTGENPDERLREVVQRAVAQGLNFGGQLGDQADAMAAADEEARKRGRIDTDGS